MGRGIGHAPAGLLGGVSSSLLPADDVSSNLLCTWKLVECGGVTSPSPGAYRRGSQEGLARTGTGGAGRGLTGRDGTGRGGAGRAGDGAAAAGRLCCVSRRTFSTATEDAERSGLIRRAWLSVLD